MLPLVGNSTLHSTQCRKRRRRRGSATGLADISSPCHGCGPWLPPMNVRACSDSSRTCRLSSVRTVRQPSWASERETTSARYFVDLRILTRSKPSAEAAGPCARLGPRTPAAPGVSHVQASARSGLPDHRPSRLRGRGPAASAAPRSGASCTTVGASVPGRRLLLGGPADRHPDGTRQANAHQACPGAGAAPRPLRPPAHRPASASRAVSDHLADFGDIPERLLRRAAAAKLAQICLGGPAAIAAEQLGTPLIASRYALRTVDEQLRTRKRRAAFDAAVDALAHDLDSTPVRTDFGRRRDALNAWSLSFEDWQDLIDDLPEQPMGGCVRSHTHWGEGKRLLASMWIWTNVTQGEHIYAPAVRPVVAGRRPGGNIGRYVHQRWRFMAAGRDGHYEARRERLDPYGSRLAARIDAGLAGPEGGPCGQSAFVNL